jgi:hypothetical protein
MKHVHVAVALDELGTQLADTARPADRAGYERLLDWATGQARCSPSASKEPGRTESGSRASSAAAVYLDNHRPCIQFAPRCSTLDSSLRTMCKEVAGNVFASTSSPGSVFAWRSQSTSRSSSRSA